MIQKLLNKGENNNNNKTTKRINTLNDKYNLKIKKIEEQTKIYQNKYNEINSELNKLRKELTIKKLDAVKIIDNKNNKVF